MTHPHHRTADVDGGGIFFREAGDRLKPALLLLHGSTPGPGPEPVAVRKQAKR